MKKTILVYAVVAFLLVGGVIVGMLKNSDEATLAERISVLEGTNVSLVEEKLNELSKNDYPSVMFVDGTPVDEETILLVGYTNGHGNTLKIVSDGVLDYKELEKKNASFIKEVKRLGKAQ